MDGKLPLLLKHGRMRRGVCMVAVSLCPVILTAATSPQAMTGVAADSVQAILIYMMVGIVVMGIGVLHVQLHQAEQRAWRAERELQRQKAAPPGNASNDAQGKRLEAVGVVASGVAHDLNNMLAPIRLSADYLHTRMQEPRDREMAELILRSTERASELLERVLSVSRGRGTGTMRFNPRHVLREIHWIARETFPATIRVELECADKLPEIQGHAGQLLQALLNLCVNARDAMPEGGELRIVASHESVPGVERIEGWLCIEVSDTGPGIPGEIRDSIFQAYFTTKQEGQGTGLGLANAQAVIQEHGGRISLEANRYGTGACFRIVLPAEEVKVVHITSDEKAIAA